MPAAPVGLCVGNMHLYCMYDAAENVRMLMDLRETYGDLNTALVGEFVKAYGGQPVSTISRELKLNRAVVRRSLKVLENQQPPEKT